MNFVYLNIKSGYSFFESTLKIEDIVNCGIKNGCRSLCLTDHNGMFGIVEFINACKNNNIKPIYGMEVNIGEDNGRNYPLVLIAKNIQGYHSLCGLTNLVSKGDLNVELAPSQLEDYKDGLIAILPSSRSYYKDLNDQEKHDYLQRFASIYDDFYFGLEYYNEFDEPVLASARKIAGELKIKTTVLVEVIAASKKDLYYYDVLQAIKQGTTYEKLEKRDNELHYFRSEEELLQHFTIEEVESTVEIANLCDFDIHAMQGQLVQYPLPDDVNASDYLRALCNKGLVKRLKGKVGEDYKNRLDYELDIITKMNFTNYFLVVWDYTRFAKQNGILVGPGRGSAAGSLVSYVLGITNVDPIKYNLLFERFLNPERITMPDIDLDFIDSRREEVVNYLCEKYSLNRVVRVIAFQTFKARSCLRDVGKALGLTLGEVNDISKRVPSLYHDYELVKLIDKSPSFKALMNAKKIYRDIYDVSLHIEGLPRQTTLHAAGIVVTDSNYYEVAPIYHPTSEVATTQYDMHYLEEFGLLKMDILGLTNLSILDDCIKMVKDIYKEEINLNTMPLHEEGIYRMIASQKTAGVFQMESPGMNRAIKIVRPSSFEDIVALLALFRPGPMGFIKNYADRKHGIEKVDYPSPVLESILEPTYGIIVYQEQIMQILVKMASFSFGKADIVRRAISKRQEDKLASIKADFISGCLRNGHRSEEAERVYDMILRFANYGFNRAHSVSYAMIVAQMASIKLHYPEVFYTAIMNVFGEERKIIDYYNEIKKTKIKVLLPSVNKSGDCFKVEARGIRFSLANIKDVPPGAVRTILQEREKGPYKDFIDFVVRCYPRGLNESQINALISAGAFDEFKDNRTTLIENLANVIQYTQITNSVVDGQITFDVTMSDRPIIVKKERDALGEIEKEKQKLGVFISAFPLEYDRLRLANAGFVTIDEALQDDGQVKIVAYVAYSRAIRTKKGDYMAHLKGIDETGEINITVFPKEYLKYEQIIRRGNYLQILGNVETRDDLTSLIVKQVKIYNLTGENGK